jgi:hypothetical protein
MLRGGLHGKGEEEGSDDDRRRQKVGRAQEAAEGGVGFEGSGRAIPRFHRCHGRRFFAAGGYGNP